MSLQNSTQAGQPQLQLQQRERNPSQVYELSLQSEWQMIRHYSADDFGHRYGWPHMEPGLRNHFLVDDAVQAAK